MITKEQIHDLGTALGLFTSAIKSGEAWSDRCEDVLTMALEALDALSTDSLIELKRAMGLAQDDIRALRQANELLRAKVDVMELFGLTLRTQPNYGSRGMGQDVVWLLQKQLDALPS